VRVFQRVVFVAMGLTVMRVVSVSVIVIAMPVLVSMLDPIEVFVDVQMREFFIIRPVVLLL
jgi:hypothetical protein